jgi:16S rRNA A1518/A1519 N6-dimethyltransferase RsmA/KsgA/DIM1 with predicted DNA glycosylase/AP lyase activity
MAEIDPEGAETKALDAIVDLTDRSILEIGAGDGRLTWRLAARARSVLALEPRKQDVARARKSMPPELRGRVRFVATDATTYRYPRARFDIAVLSWSL